MTEPTGAQHEEPADAAAHAHGAIHLPPNSWAPISVALALAVLFTGFLTDIRSTIGPVMWVVGLVWLVASCVVWVRGARTEYRGLPEDGQH